MKALSLFSGIGGIDLACEWAGIETVAFCEREPFCQAVIRKRWPGVPIYDDVRTLTKERLEADGIDTRTIRLISAGYPCQPFSYAGKREGEEDDRHLWPEVFRLNQEIRPDWFVGENVAGHVTLGLDDVLSDLGNIGYAFQPFVIPACAVGSPQRRDRVFVVANSQSINQGGLSVGKEPSYTGFTLGGENVANSEGIGWNTWGSESEREQRGFGTSSGGSQCKDVANSTGERCRETGEHQSERHSEWITGGSGYQHTWSIESELGGMLDGVPRRLDGHRWPAYWGEEQHEWEPSRLAVGVKNRPERIKALGNAVNPHQIYPILAAIKQIDDMLRGEAGIESNEQPSPKGAAAE